MLRKRYKAASFDRALIGRAVADAFRKLDPRVLVRNPVIFVTAVVSALVTVLFVRDLLTGQPAAFSGQIAAWLWFTVLFANFAEAIAEGRGRAQADALRRTRTDATAKRLADPKNRERYRNASRRSTCGPATPSWWSPARSSPATATSSRASPR